jgi:hypothetical protein
MFFGARGFENAYFFCPGKSLITPQIFSAALPGCRLFARVAICRCGVNDEAANPADGWRVMAEASGHLQISATFI